MGSREKEAAEVVVVNRVVTRNEEQKDPRIRR